MPSEPPCGYASHSSGEREGSQSYLLGSDSGLLPHYAVTVLGEEEQRGRSEARPGGGKTPKD